MLYVAYPLLLSCYFKTVLLASLQTPNKFTNVSSFANSIRCIVLLQTHQMVFIFNMNEHCYFSVNVCNNSIFSKSVELLINIFWRSNICTIANLTNRNKWFHTFIQNSLFYRLSHNAIQIWMLTGLCEELLLLDLL